MSPRETEVSAEGWGLRGRIAAFSLPSVVSFIAPLVVLPLVASSADVSEWAALGIGQALGALVGIVVAYGWPMVGPVEIASGDRVGEVFYESLLTRGCLLTGTLPVVALMSWAAAPTGTLLLAGLTGAASATLGLSSQWVAVGTGNPWSITLLEHLPRLVIMVAGGGLIAAGGSLYLYPASIACSSLVALVLFARFAVRPLRPSGSWVGVLRTRLAAQWSAGATSLAASAYSAGALFVVGITASATQTAQMASADRLFRVGLTGVVVLSSALQAWVVHRDAVVGRARQRRAVAWHIGLGLVGAVTFAGAAPSVARLLFGSDVAFGHAVSTAYGLAFLCISVGTSVAQHVLVPGGHVRSALSATVAGAAVGVPLLLVLADAEGAAGGAVALAVSELVVLAVLLWRASVLGATIGPEIGSVQ